MVPSMTWQRNWVNARGLPPWRPEVQRAGGADGYWVDVYVPSAEELEQRRRQKSEKEAALAELTACQDASDVAGVIRSRGTLLPTHSTVWYRPFGLLVQGGAVIRPTHQFHRMRLAFPHRIFDWRKIVVDSAPHHFAWQTRPGKFVSTDGHGWCTNFHFGAAGKLIEERLLRGEVPTSYSEPWVGTGTGNPTATVVVPIDELPKLVVDASVYGTKKRLQPGVMISDYSSVTLAEIVQLMK
jgi:hypothetical protein